MLWLFDFVMTTVSVVGFCILGVAGQIDDVAVADYGYYVQTDLVPGGVSIPPFAYYNPNHKWAKAVMYHEEGHLIQHRSMQGWYWLAVGVTSVVGYHTGTYLWDTEADPNTYMFGRIYEGR